jgi:hypothetical protein
LIKLKTGKQQYLRERFLKAKYELCFQIIRHCEERNCG